MAAKKKAAKKKSAKKAKKKSSKKRASKKRVAKKSSKKKSSKKKSSKKKAGKRKPARKAAKKKPARKARPGKPKSWRPEEVEEAFRRFREASPAPQTELKHINPYTLLVAVVLSAQATDAGVNKATPGLFAAADTPEKMVVLGEAKVRNLIKTIGLYRTKAKNVIGLSKKLIAERAA